MPVLTVYLGEICNNSGLSSAEKTSIQSTLLAWFTQVCATTSYTAAVQWTNSAPGSILATDLLCYFMPSQSDSVIRHAPGYSSGAGQSHGFTFTSATANASEVYVASCRGNGATWFTELAFHELMHNKLALDNAGLHNRGGLAQASVTTGMVPSTRNINEMKAAVATSRPQWTGGWGAITCPDPNDPLAGL
jgi:hypothetical protein